MTPAATDLATIGADVEWPDAEAALSARSAGHESGGRLGELIEWLAGTQGRYPPSCPSRPRCVVLGAVVPAVASLAESLRVGIRNLDVPSGADTRAALQLGIDLADAEVEAGADVLIVSDPGSATAVAVVVSLMTGAEPVAMLPRGAAATDTSAWIALAQSLRDRRRELAGLRASPDELLARLDDPWLAAAAGLILRAVSRRTPVVLDGTAVVVAALLSNDVQPRAGHWWRVADTSPDPVHSRACAELTQRPLLDLSTSRGDGLAGLLTVPLLRAATTLASRTGLRS